ncbi:MAG: sigma-70 family RNA polymerase sigma factor [Deltaproteobacteria bacterium]|nr:sigma-70 family RNA polymerase sigma factor [Deltaproteobacteria bacterium]
MDRATERAVLTAYREHYAEGTPIPRALAAQVDGLFASCQRRVYAVCRRMSGSEEAALDLAQDTLLTGYRKLHEFRGDSAFGTWLYGIARGLCMNAIRRRREVLSEDGLLETGDDRASVLAGLRREEREELVRQAASTLSPLEQEAVYLRYVEDLPQDRITKLLGITQASGARGVLQKCRRTLARELRARLDALGHGTSFFRASIT